MIRIDDMPYLEEIQAEKAIATQGSSGGSLSVFGEANGDVSFVDANGELFVFELPNNGSISTGFANVVAFAADPDGASVNVGASGTASGDFSSAFSSASSFSNGTVAFGTATVFTFAYTSP